MKKVMYAVGVVLLMLASACTKNDCSCTYYNKSGEAVDNYNSDLEDMYVASCSDLSTIDESEIGDQEHKGYICK